MRNQIFGMAFLLLTLLGCGVSQQGGGGFNIFSIEDDKQLGQQVDNQIMSDTSPYVILSRNQYPIPYSHLDRITQTILNSGKVNLRNEFDWTFRIIYDDTTLNAFAAPGGYVYVYSGLIKFLEREDELAGVMAHEIAHVDRRHTTQQLTKVYGISLLLEIALGKNQNILSDVAATLVFLKFSRDDEAEADEFSVTYLCPTAYRADGAAGFFIQLEKQGSSSPPEFLSSHPNPANRVQDIEMRADTLGCDGTATYETRYQALKNSLPGK